MRDSSCPGVLLISADLFFGSRIQGAVSGRGASLSVASSGPAAVARLLEGDSQLVLIDLETTGLAVAEIIRAANLRIPTPTVAYAPHVKQRLLTSAMDAGCTEVLSRGKFDATMDALVGRYLTSSA